MAARRNMIPARTTKKLYYRYDLIQKSLTVAGLGWVCTAIGFDKTNLPALKARLDAGEVFEGTWARFGKDPAALTA